MNSPISSPEVRGQKAAVFKVAIDTPLGAIRSRVAVQTGPMRLAELVPLALELTEIMCSRAKRREESEGRHISCGPACDACCRQMVPVSIPEALVIRDLLDSFAPRVRGAFMERFERIASAMKKWGFFKKLVTDPFDDGSVYELAVKYLHWSIPCPFLVRRSCSIHNFRPVACREYNVTSDPSMCSEPFEKPVRKVPMPKPMSMPLARLAADLTHSTPRLIPLSLVPSWVEQNPDYWEKTWPGPELFKKFLEHLGPASKNRENDEDGQERTTS